MTFIYDSATTTVADEGRRIKLKGFSVSREQHFGFCLFWQGKVIPVLAIPDFKLNALERADHWILYSVGASIGRYNAFHFTQKEEFEEATQVTLEALTFFPYSPQRDRLIFAKIDSRLMDAISSFTP